MMLLLIAGLVAGGMSLLLLGLQPDNSRKIIQQRVYAEVAQEAATSQRSVAKWVQPLVALNQRLRIRQGGSSKAHDNLVAGKVTLTGVEFFAIKQMAAFLGMLVYVGSVGWGAVKPLWLFGAAVIGFLLPELWLRQRIMARRSAIGRDMPEVVDLLALSVEAGADFMGALQRVVREFRPSPIREELSVVLQEVRVGKRRRDAFRSLANRVRMPEVTGFARTVIYADRMGTGMSEALNILAEDSRLRRYHAAERFAQQAPLKMLLPLVFVMMAVLIIVSGPIVIQFVRGQLIPKF